MKNTEISFFGAALTAALLLCGAPARAGTATTTADGLQRLDDSVMAQAWAKPGVDLGEYTHIMIQPVGVEFEDVSRVSRDPYPIDERQKRMVLEVVPQVLGAELGKLKCYALTNEAGANVLILQSAVIDIVSHVPPEPIGRGRTFVRNLGEATLVVELRDSMTNEVVARAVERRAVSPTFVQRSNSVSNAAEVREAAARWAADLRRQLDAFSQL